MGSITRSLANNITTSGVILPAGITNSSVSAVTSFANASGGTLILLSTQTASASASISFTTGLNSTYDKYIFTFINIHPSVSNADLMINFSTDGGSNYNVTKTSNHFRALHDEADTSTSLGYGDGTGQSTADVSVLINIGATDSDMSGSGYVELYNPSSTTFVKHFIAVANRYDPAVFTVEQFTAGYANTTSAINAVIFRMDSGNIDDGIIKLYGVKK